MSIVYSVAIIGGLGLVFGTMLAIAGKLLAVAEDPKVALIREALPGANCGGCGKAGCDAFAVAVAAGEASIKGCPVGGSSCAKRIAEIMGVAAEEIEPTTAYIKCKGTISDAQYRYEYYGINDCGALSMLAGGGSKACPFGCLGAGSCKNSCVFGAIDIVDGIAVINRDLCTACGACVKTCPRDLIEMIPASKTVRVACNSHDNGKTVKSYCSVGCISCKICEKACEYDAIHVGDMLAHVDYEKCVLCMACVAKCPTKVIVDLLPDKKV